MSVPFRVPASDVLLTSYLAVVAVEAHRIITLGLLRCHDRAASLYEFKRSDFDLLDLEKKVKNV